MGQITSREIIWAAGFLEGEGCFTLNTQSPRVMANQVQKEPLERLHRIFGGSLRGVKARKGCQPQWAWVLYSASAIAVMMTLYQFMSPDRKAQIRAVIAAWKASPRKPYKSHLRRVSNGKW